MNMNNAYSVYSRLGHLFAEEDKWATYRKTKGGELKGGKPKPKKPASS